MLTLNCQSKSFVPVKDIPQKLVSSKIRFHRRGIIHCLGCLNHGTEQLANALLNQLFLSERPLPRELLGRI